MADGGQRLLDVIDDPNALESFLGGLTADSEYLPENDVVASLARTLEGEDYEVDSPNETLFESLEASSNQLTDISQSYVPSDFDNVGNINNTTLSGGDGIGSFTLVGIGNGSLQASNSRHGQQNESVTSGSDQFVSNTNTNNSNSFTNSICDSSSNTTTSSHFVQQQNQQVHIQNSTFITQNFSQEHQLQQQAQLASLSSSLGQSGGSVDGSSSNNLISVAVSGANGISGGSDGSQVTSGAGNVSFQQINEATVTTVTQQQQGQVQTQQQSTSVSVVNVVNASNSSNTNNSSTLNSELTSTNNIPENNNTIISNASISTLNNSAVQQQQQQQYNIVSAGSTLNHLVSGQTVSISNMGVAGTQLIASSNGNLVATGQNQNIIQQIQSANNQTQGYITIEQPTMLTAGATAFGTHNLALVATGGGAPTYAVLPTGSQILTNAIMTQPQTIQTLTKSANGTFFQTAGGQLVSTAATNQITQNIQNVNVNVANVRPKQPPQLLPKPSSQGSAAASPTVTSTGQAISTSNSTNIITATTSEAVSAGTTTQVTSVCGTTVSADGAVTQILQQQQGTSQVVTSMGSTMPTFTIGNAAGLGQVMVNNVSTMSATNSNQTQLTGTIVVNQLGQPMLIPSASMAQGGGLQFILRQQPTQPQVLTIQAPTAATTLGAQTAQAGSASGKPIVRYVSQVPQVAQTNTHYGLQQIQTANGQTAWVAVRYPQSSQSITTTSPTPFAQIQSESVGGGSVASVPVSSSLPVQAQITTQQQQLQLQLQQQQMQQQQLQQQQQEQQQMIQQQQQQQQLEQQQQQLKAQQQQQQLQQQQQQLQQQQQQQQQQLKAQQQQQQSTVSTPDSSDQPPPKKKAKSKPKKKVVTLDLEQLLKQSGIMDEDLQDDDTSFDTSFLHDPSNGLTNHQPIAQPTPTPPSPVTPNKPNGISVLPMKTDLPVNILPTVKPGQKTTPKKKPPSKGGGTGVSGGGISKKKKTPEKKLPSPPPPPPIKTPPSKSKKKSNSGAGASPVTVGGGTPKPEIKKETKTDKSAPKKLSSLDSLFETIAAVAASARARSPSPLPHASQPIRTPPRPPVKPTPPPPVTPPVTPLPVKAPSSSSNSSISSPSPGPGTSSSSSKSSKNTPPKKTSSLSSIASTIALVASSSNFEEELLKMKSMKKKTSTMSPKSINASSPKSNSGSKKKKNAAKVSSSTLPASPQPSLPARPQPLPPPVAVPTPPPPTVTTPPISSSPPTTTATFVGPSQTTPGGGSTRIVQTIQLSLQNQQLLRNIQLQISRLVGLPVRNETEQTALQKLIVLQQQVIATGTPVPNPSLANLPTKMNQGNVQVLGAAAATTVVNAISSLGTAPPVTMSSATLAATVNSTLTSLAAASSSNNMTTTTTSYVIVPSSTVSSTSNCGSVSSAATSLATATSAPIPISMQSNNNNAITSSSTNFNNSLETSTKTTTFGQTQTSDATTNLNVNVNETQTKAGPLSVAADSTTASTPIVISKTEPTVYVSRSTSTDFQVHSPNSANNLQNNTLTTTNATSATSTQFQQKFGNLPNLQQIVNTNTVHQAPPFRPSAQAIAQAQAKALAEEKKAEEERLARAKAEEEERLKRRKEQFEANLKADQDFVVKPDYDNPFQSQYDAMDKLRKYHIFRDQSYMNFEEFDTEFSEKSCLLLDKFSGMVHKYRGLLLKESMREVSCAERVMMERLFVGEERVKFDHDKHAVSNGEILDLPPPPESWIPKIQDMVDMEIKELERDSIANQQVQSAIDSIMSFGNNDMPAYPIPEEGEKVEYDAFGVPTNSSSYSGLNSASSADIDEAVRSILA